MDLLECVKSVYDYTIEANPEISIEKENKMNKNIESLGFISIISFDKFLKNILNLPLPYEDKRFPNYAHFYKECISILKRKEKLNKIVNKIK